MQAPPSLFSSQSGQNLSNAGSFFDSPGGNSMFGQVTQLPNYWQTLGNPIIGSTPGFAQNSYNNLLPPTFSLGLAQNPLITNYPQNDDMFNQPAYPWSSPSNPVDQNLLLLTQILSNIVLNPPQIPYGAPSTGNPLADAINNYAAALNRNKSNQSSTSNSEPAPLLPLTPFDIYLR